jgi:hypothetical protein
MMRVAFFAVAGALGGAVIASQVTDTSCELCGLNVLGGIYYGALVGAVVGIVIVALDPPKSETIEQEDNPNSDEESSNHREFETNSPSACASSWDVRVIPSIWGDANANAVCGLILQAEF